MSHAEEVLGRISATRGWREELYVHLHAHPELSSHEVETAAEIARRLEGFGYEVHRIGGGVVGILTNGAGRTVLMRADIDALPVTELTQLPYASTVTTVDESGGTVGVSHACGHDAHITCLLGAAEVLAGARDVWGRHLRGALPAG